MIGLCCQVILAFTASTTFCFREYLEVRKGEKLTPFETQCRLNFSGNSMSHNGFLTAGKPILRAVDTMWGYKIESDNCSMLSLCLMYDNKPYWTYYPKTDIDGAMTAMFDLLSGLSKELPKNEIVDLLSTVHSITYDLSGLVVYDGEATVA